MTTGTISFILLIVISLLIVNFFVPMIKSTLIFFKEEMSKDKRIKELEKENKDLKSMKHEEFVKQEFNRSNYGTKERSNS